MKIKNQRSKIKTVVLMGGWSREREISIKSGQAMFKNLSPGRYCKRALVINKDKTLILLPEDAFPSEENIEKIVPRCFLEVFKELKEWEIDVALLALHGEGGEDGVVQGFLETLEIPYTHSGVAGSAVSMDKELSKAIYLANGIPTPDFFVAGEKFGEWIAQKNFKYPLVAKPLCQGSSFGVSIINNIEELNSLKPGSDLLVERHIPGREFTCVAFRRSPGKRPEAMPVTEIVPEYSSFFDFESKYTIGATKEITPANLPEDVARNIQDYAVKCHSVLKCGSVSRTDVILSTDNDIFVLETNSIPGMTETSILPQEAEAMGISFSEMLDIMIDYAIEKKSKLKSQI